MILCKMIFFFLNFNVLIDHSKNKIFSLIFLASAQLLAFFTKYYCQKIINLLET